MEEPKATDANFFKNEAWYKPPLFELKVEIRENNSSTLRFSKTAPFEGATPFACDKIIFVLG